MKAHLHPLQNHGMSRDLSVSKAENTFAWENYNVRITTEGDDTLLSITNERGTRLLTGHGIDGTVIGWNTLNDNLVVFTHSGTTDRIYRIYGLSPEYPTEYDIDTVATGNLGFDTEHPIESVMSYESEEVQKIYWIDGVHVLRCCNIMTSYGSVSDPTMFDSTKGMQTVVSVATEKDNGGSTRPNGTIQYFVTAYNKLGVETGIIGSSSLVYLSPLDRGGAANETNNNRIIVTISGLDNCGFDYIRVYGVLRTSQNGTPVASIISEVPITRIYHSSTIYTDPVEVVDNGANYLGTVDYSVLLFLGSKDVVPNTMTQKDNTLFLGNLNVRSNDYSTLDTLAANCRNSGTGISTVVSFVSEGTFSIAPPISTYPYSLQLNKESSQIKIFKAKEKYRFAVVFIKPNGDRSKAFWLGDKECPEYPTIYNDEVEYNIAEAGIPSAMCAEAIRLGYQFAQLYIAEATYADRSVKAQGFLNPTVFNLYDRYNDQPYARPSWMARPMSGNVEYMHMYSLHNTDSKSAELQSNAWITNRPRAYYMKNNGVIDRYVPEAWLSRDTQPEVLAGHTGVKVEMYWTFNSAHSKFQGTIIYFYTDETPSGGEIPSGATWYVIKSVFISTTDLSWLNFKEAIKAACISDPVLKVYYVPSDAALEGFYNNLPSGGQRSELVDTSVSLVGVEEVQLTSAGTFCQYSRQHYFVDCNLVTMHSPEIEYNQINIDRQQGSLKFRIIGAAQISASTTDSNMQVQDSNYVGNNILKYNYSTPNISNLVGTLTAAPMYYDSLVTLGESGDYYPAVGRGYYMTYLWHKTGSMINYTDGNGRAYGSLVTKRFANMQFAYYTHYASNNHPWDLRDIRQITGYSSGLYEVNTYEGTKTYAVNVPTTVITPIDYKYPIYTTALPSSTYADGVSVTDTAYSSDPVQVAYNSRPHLLLAFPGASSSSSISGVTILPNRGGSDGTDIYDINENFVTNHTYARYISSTGKAIATVNFTTDVWQAIQNSGTGLQTIYFSGMSIGRVVVEYRGGSINLDLSTEVVEGLIKLSSSNTSTVSGKSDRKLLIYFNVTSYTPDLYFYFGGTLNPVNIYGAAGLYYLGWTDTKTFQESDIDQDTITIPSFTSSSSPYLWIAELYDPFSNGDTRYGGTTESAVQNNTFIPCGPRVALSSSGTALTGTEGDTYFQRYDCVMSYPQSENDINQVFDIASVMLETHVNIDGRTDKDRGVGQLADVDYTQYGVINPVYNQENNFIQAKVFDEKFNSGVYPSTITWSLEKHPLETNDTWMGITLASTMTMDAAYGPVNALRRFNNTIIAFQDKAVSEVLFNSRVQLTTSDGVPVELANSKKVEGKRTLSNHYGCINKWSIVEGKSGLYFKDDLAKVIAVFNGQAIDALSTKAKLDAWVKSSAYPAPWTPGTWKNTVAYYDNISSDVYFVNSATVSSGGLYVDAPYPCLVYNEQLGNFVGFFSYGSLNVITNLSDKLLAIKNGANNGVWALKEGFYNNFFNSYKPSYVIWRVTPEPYGDKIWTNLEYRADFMTMLNGYGDDVYTEGQSPTGYGSTSPGEYLPDMTFDSIRVWNEYQDTGTITATDGWAWGGPSSLEDSNNPDIRKKFRIWRADIPRDTHDTLGLNRIRNPWIWLKIQKNFSASDGLNQVRFQLHDMVVKYFTTD